MMARTRARIGASFIALWAVTFAVAHVLDGLWGAAVFLGGPVAVLLWRVVPRMRGLLQQSREGLERTGRRWRYALAEADAAYAWPAWLRLLWYLAALLCLMTVMLMLIVPRGMVVDVVSATAGTFLMVVVAIDVLHLVRVGLRRGAAKGLRIALASVGTAIVTAVALSVARKTVFAWTGEDPSAFPAAITLFTAVLVPLGWLALSAAGSVLLMLPMMLITLWQMGNTGRVNREGHFHALLVAWRPFLVCTVPLYLFSQVWGWHDQDWPLLRRWGTTTVVLLDYWDRPVCGGARGLANRVEEDRYSVVVSGHNLAWRFRAVACPSPGTSAGR